MKILMTKVSDIPIWFGTCIHFTFYEIPVSNIIRTQTYDAEDDIKYFEAIFDIFPLCNFVQIMNIFFASYCCRVEIK